MSSNQEIANKATDLTGGKENSNNAWHCLTRLRFNLNDNVIESKGLGHKYFCKKSSPTFFNFNSYIEKYTPTTEQNSS